MDDGFKAPALQAIEDGRDEGGVVIDSVALARLLEEVRNEAPVAPSAYNRTYNRHNR